MMHYIYYINVMWNLFHSFEISFLQMSKNRNAITNASRNDRAFEFEETKIPAGIFSLIMKLNFSFW